MLTPEQAQQYRTQYNLGGTTPTGSSGTPSTPAERIAKLRMGGTPPPATDTQSQAPQGLLGKIASGINTAGSIADNTVGKLANFAFGSTGKTVGSLMTPVIGAGISTVGGVTGNENTQQYGEKVQEQGKQEMDKAPVDVGFTALELYPGGKLVEEGLSKLPGGVKVLEHLASLPEGLKKQAVEQYSKVFNATSKESKALVKETVPGLIDRGVTFKDPKKLVDTAESQATNYGEKVGQFFDNLPATAKEQTKPILDKLSALKDKYVVEGKVIRPEAVNAIDATMQKISQYGKDISTESVRKLRQIFDEHYSVSKGIDDISAYTKKAERAGADAIRAEFAKTRPDLAKLNSEYSFWSNEADLATYTAEKSKGAVGRGIGSIIGAGIGAEQGKGVTGKVEGATVGAILGNKAVELFRSPAWKTTSAVTKSRLADSIIKGEGKQVELIASKILSSGKNLISGLFNQGK